jgi:hypothetical protein
VAFEGVEDNAALLGLVTVVELILSHGASMTQTA